MEHKLFFPNTKHIQNNNSCVQPDLFLNSIVGRANPPPPPPLRESNSTSSESSPSVTHWVKQFAHCNCSLHTRFLPEQKRRGNQEKNVQRLEIFQIQFLQNSIPSVFLFTNKLTFSTYKPALLTGVTFQNIHTETVT